MLFTSSLNPRVITWPSLNGLFWQCQQLKAELKRVNLIRGFLRWSHASLRTGPDPEGDAAAGDSGCSPADGGDFDGAGRGGQELGESRRETAALQDNQTQPEAQPRSLFSGRFPRSPKHPHRLTGSPAPWCGRGEAHCAQEGCPGLQQ